MPKCSEAAAAEYSAIALIQRLFSIWRRQLGAWMFVAALLISVGAVGLATADESASSEGAEGTGGEGGDCGDCGADTVDSKDGDVCPEDKDCEDCETGGADESDNEDLVSGDGDPVPVAWDTGEKWESVVDLIVRVNGDDFELIRNYSSDPQFHSTHLYNSNEIPSDFRPYSGSVEWSPNLYSVVERPTTRPSVGAGWAFANLRSVSVAQSWGCIQTPGCAHPDGRTGTFLGGRVWLNRPGRKPRTFDFFEPLGNIDPATDDPTVTPLSQTGVGNQSVTFLEASVQPARPWPQPPAVMCQLAICPGVNPARSTYTPMEILEGVVRLNEPGKWNQEFKLIGHVGFITKHEDAFGNRRVFEYGAHGVPTRIYLNGTATTQASGDQAEAWVDLFWQGTATQGTASAPKLVRAEVRRPTGATSSVITQYVEYYHLVSDNGLKIKYHDGDNYVTVGTASSHLGSAGDLVQVVVGEVTDPLAGSPKWRTAVTQYRYHGNGAPSSSDIRLDTIGLDHQLKMVFKPQQIEYVAQLIREDDPLAIDDMTLVETATGLLTLDDDAAIYTGAPVSVFEAAEKIVSYNTSQSFVANKTVASPVHHQFVQASDCGCGGGGAVTAKLRTYEQVDGWSAVPAIGAPTLTGQSMHIKEYLLDDFSALPTGTPYRTYAQDMLMLGEDSDKPYTWFKATIDEATGSAWVSENLYDYNKRSLTGKYFPSTFTSYTRATATPSAPAVTRVADGEGFMVQYGYETDSTTSAPANENVSTVAKGPKGSPAVVSTTIHRSDNSFRHHLPASRTLHRVAGSSSPEDLELINFEYRFDETDPFRILWVKTIRERETLAENGPSTASQVVSWEFYDAKGNASWTIDEGGTVTHYEYGAITGELVRITENADPSDTSTASDLTLTGSGNPFGSLTHDSVAGELVTEYDRDLLGRIIKSTEPGGVERWTVRDMMEDAERPGILYFTMTTLPHEAASGVFAGPAQRRFMDGAGDPIRTETMPVSGGSAYDPDAGTWTLLEGEDDILSRAILTHDLTGAVTKQTEWWDYGASAAEKSRKHETLFSYDALGRLTDVTDPTGTITRNFYDVLDRVTSVYQSSTASGSFMLPLVLYFFDGNPAASVQGVGNGSISRISVRTADDLSGGIRLQQRHYDYRNRLIGIVPESNAPIQVIRYDNLDRPIETASYHNQGASPTTATFRSLASGPLPHEANLGLMNAAVPRAAFMKYSYSQRGLTYRREAAIDPESSTPTFLASNYWFDEDGNELASWEPNSPGTVTAYDAHDRPTTMWLTDRAGDTASLSVVGRYAQATGVTGDHVLEEASYQYDSTSGVPTLVTSRLRRHGATATGALALTASDTVTSYTGFLYDSALRPTATINFGTNQTGFQTGSTTAPSLSAYSAGLSALLADGDILFTHRTYNTRGLVRDVTGTQDGTALITRYVYDHMYRPIAVIENADEVDETDVSWATNRYAVAGQSVDHPDRDRVTSFAYNGVGQVTARVAHIPESDGGSGSQESVQETRYVYGVRSGANISTDPMNSSVFSNRLVASVNYPHETTGLADPTGTNSAYDHLRVSYAYNTQGELRGVTDQNGTVRWIHRNNTGQVTHDIVHAAGTGIDTTVRRLSYTYDGLGRLVSAASHDNTDPAADPMTDPALDEVAFAYTPLWQIQTVAQQHDGPVTGTSPTVAYRYETAIPGDSDGNYSRLSKVIYPTDFTGAIDSSIPGTFTEDTVRLVYNSGMDDRLSRVSKLQVNGLTGVAGLQDLVAYDRIGMGMTARVRLPNAGTGASQTWETVLDRTKKIDGSSAAGAYPAYDRFGRVTNHMWARSDYGVQSPLQTYANQPPVVAVSHTYDRMSNKLTAADARPGARLPFRDRIFTYDQLNRLVNEERTPTPASGYVEQHLAKAWDLDMLGNSDMLLTDVEKDGDASDAAGTNSRQVRSHNKANEIDDPNPSAQFDMFLQNASGSMIGRYWQFAYDDAGNMTEERTTPAIPVPPNKVPGQIMTYDAWNRLVDTNHEPSVGAQVAVSEYRYNALGWRTKKRFDSSTGAYDGIDQERIMLYDAGWRMVEERIDTDLAVEGTPEEWISQQFWGMRYIDDAVAKRINRDLADEDGWVDNPGVSLWYQITDSQFSVVAVLDRNGSLNERVAYDAYGVARHRPAGDVNGDRLYSYFGDVQGKFGDSIGGTIYHADWDLNFDGIVDSTDFGIMNAQGSRTTAIPAGWISDPRAASTGPDNSIGYAGYVFNPEREDYTVRFRVYAPEFGRWRQRDPIGYADGSGLYEYVQGRATSFADQTGLSSDKPIDWSAPDEEIRKQIDAARIARCEALKQQINTVKTRLRHRTVMKDNWDDIANNVSGPGMNQIIRSNGVFIIKSKAMTNVDMLLASIRGSGPLGLLITVSDLLWSWNQSLDGWDRSGLVFSGIGAGILLGVGAAAGGPLGVLLVGTGGLIVFLSTDFIVQNGIVPIKVRNHARDKSELIQRAIEDDRRSLRRLADMYRFYQCPELLCDKEGGDD